MPYRWFSYVFTYNGSNHALLGFFNAIELVLQTGFAVTAFLALILNLILPEEIEDEETPELTANEIDTEKDQEEWDRIKGKSADVEQGHDGSLDGGSASEPAMMPTEALKFSIVS